MLASKVVELINTRIVYKPGVKMTAVEEPDGAVTLTIAGRTTHTKTFHRVHIATLAKTQLPWDIFAEIQEFETLEIAEWLKIGGESYGIERKRDPKRDPCLPPL